MNDHTIGAALAILGAGWLTINAATVAWLDWRSRQDNKRKVTR